MFDYLKYLKSSTNEHGVHSPFVFDLITKVIYFKDNYYAYSGIEDLREELLEDERTIVVSDLGAGPTTFNAKTKCKKIRQIAKHSAKPEKYAQLLFRLVNYFQPSNVLELGTSLGISTAYLASANSVIKVITVEGCPEIAKIASQNFEKLGLKNIDQVIGNFEDVLPAVLGKQNHLDFVFFDGNHRKDATLNYFKQCLLKSNEKSVFIFDDINWSAGMQEAWSEIKNNSAVSVTIDLFFMGIVFFRKEQVKQHFVIRF